MGPDLSQGSTRVEHAVNTDNTTIHKENVAIHVGEVAEDKRPAIRRLWVLRIVRLRARVAREKHNSKSGESAHGVVVGVCVLVPSESLIVLDSSIMFATFCPSL